MCLNLEIHWFVIRIQDYCLKGNAAVAFGKLATLDMIQYGVNADSYIRTDARKLFENEVATWRSQLFEHTPTSFVSAQMNYFSIWKLPLQFTETRGLDQRKANNTTRTTEWLLIANAAYVKVSYYQPVRGSRPAEFESIRMTWLFFFHELSRRHSRLIREPQSLLRISHEQWAGRHNHNSCHTDQVLISMQFCL